MQCITILGDLYMKLLIQITVMKTREEVTMDFQNHMNNPMMDFSGKDIFSHPVSYLRECNLYDYRTFRYVYC